jgi:hypothetical protein
VRSLWTTVRRMEETNRICPWCSTPIPSTADACPKCGALVEGAIAKDLPGITVVDPTAKLPLDDEGNIPDDFDPKALYMADQLVETPPNDAAFDPPSEAVLIEMRKMELEAQIENAGTTIMNPTGDESIEVGPPSEEALEALDAGLLDETGPSGENLEAMAAPWEDPELEHKLAQWKSTDLEP